MRLTCVIALACAACQGSSPAPSPAPAATSRAPTVTLPPADAGASTVAPWGLASASEPAAPTPAPREITPTALAAAAHGRSIIAVALADDGSAALTIDTGNNVRLWPSFDGTREPLAVPLVAPEELVLAREGDGFAIAALDSAGGLALLRIDATGNLVGKAPLPFEQPYTQVIAAGDSYFALRADQVIERLAHDGTVLGALPPGTGERIANIIPRRGRALALIASAEGVVGRWLDPAGGVSWGDTTPKLDIDPITAVLSPVHTMIAAVQSKSRRAVLVELATGNVTPLRGNRRDLIPLGWTADDRVAFVHDELELSQVEWFDPQGKRISMLGDDFELEFFSVLSMEAADDQVVGFTGHQLGLVSPRKIRYLGYQLHAASRLRASPAGVIAALGGSSEILDDRLQIDRRLPTAHARDVLPIDDTHTLAITGAPTSAGRFDDVVVAPRRRERGVEVVLFEGAERKQVMRLPISQPRLHYEPATQLLAVVSGAKVTFVRFDPAAGQFGLPITLPVASRVREVVLLDPALARGNVALVVHGARGELVVRTIHEAELTLASGLLPSAAVALPGELEAVDRAGHVYLREDADTISIHDGTARLGRLTGMRNLKVRPAPDGTRVASFGRGRILLANIDGTPRWSIGFPGIKDVQWTDTELVALASGIAKLDPEDGSTVAARCGWKFGLRNHASFMDLAGSTICDR